VGCCAFLESSLKVGTFNLFQPASFNHPTFNLQPFSTCKLQPSTHIMDWQLLGLSFITVFLAEIGDKSQLAAIALGGSQKSARAVFFGSVAALLLASLIGVLAGEGVAQLFPPRILKAIAAVGFALMALRLLWPSTASIEEQ
jgi:putative Ca2+/H+ antiporter (TMEM165/GDT1 family)